MTDYSDKPLFIINVIKTKPGMVDEFIRRQLDGLPRLGPLPGLTESRLLRAEDGTGVVIMSGYESEEAFRAFQESPEFAAERAKMAPLVENVRPAFYRLVHEREPV
jgi:heme-degrading monooxygenase HmoA